MTNSTRPSPPCSPKLSTIRNETPKMFDTRIKTPPRRISPRATPKNSPRQSPKSSPPISPSARVRAGLLNKNSHACSNAIRNVMKVLSPPATRLSPKRSPSPSISSDSPSPNRKSCVLNIVQENKNLMAAIEQFKLIKAHSPTKEESRKRSPRRQISRRGDNQFLDTRQHEAPESTPSNPACDDHRVPPLDGLICRPRKRGNDKIDEDPCQGQERIHKIPVNATDAAANTTSQTDEYGLPRRASKRIRNLNSRKPDIPNLTPMGLPKKVHNPSKKAKFSVEEIYTNQNFKLPPARSLETIYEEKCKESTRTTISPRKAEAAKPMGRKLHRAIYFQTDPNLRKINKTRRKRQMRKLESISAPVSASSDSEDDVMSSDDSGTGVSRRLFKKSAFQSSRTRRGRRKSTDNRDRLDWLLLELREWEDMNMMTPN